MISLVPAQQSDKRKIFNWLTDSNLTGEMFGPPKFPDNPIPTWEEFQNDYKDYYFNGSQPLKGRCFLIQLNDQQVGQINYNEINSETKSTEIDIWLADRKFTGKGIGTAAIKLMIDWLFNEFNCSTIYIQPSKRNINAIKSYMKAGFLISTELPDNFSLDYSDSIVMVCHKPA